MSTLIYQFIKRIGCPLGMRLGTFTQHRPIRFDGLMAKESTDLGSESGLTVGIVTPSKDQGGFIEGAMDSVLGQGIANLRYAVIDGGSGDETVQYIQMRADRLFHWCSEQDRGQSQAINKGFACVLEGDGMPMGPMDVMGWLNADDRLLPGTLRLVLEYFERNPDVDLVYGHRIVLDEDGAEVGRWVLPKHTPRSTWWGHYAPQETMFWRRRVWDSMIADAKAVDSDVRGVDESLHFSMDWDLFIRLEEAAHKAGHRVERVDAFLGAFTTHPSQKSVAYKERFGRKEFALIRDRHCGQGLKRLACRVRTYCLLLRSIPSWWRWRLSPDARK